MMSKAAVGSCFKILASVSVPSSLFALCLLSTVPWLLQIFVEGVG